ncbi:MAG: V-type ATP synthase subunit I [Spirochaetes bacterium]|nr:V-type ATP synthase subunit I [Spirochaetota bacterium]
MALEEVVKVEITAHNSVMDRVLEDIQELGILQIDENRIDEWESEKQTVEDIQVALSDLKKKLIDIEKALSFLDRYAPKVPLLQKFRMRPDEVSRHELCKEGRKGTAAEIGARALEIEEEISKKDAALRERAGLREALLPIQSLDFGLSELAGARYTAVVSRIDRERYDGLASAATGELVHVESLGGAETVYFLLAAHEDAKGEIETLKKQFHFEPIVFPESPQSPASLIAGYEKEIRTLEDQKRTLGKKAEELALEIGAVKRYYDFLQTEIEKETAKQRLFFTTRTFVIQGWMKKKDYALLEQRLGHYGEAAIGIVEKEEGEVPPVAYRNNPVVSPYEIIVNLYSPPNHKEIDPTPILMPFYSLFFGICLTEAGYGLVIMILTALGLVLLRPRGGMKKFLTLFLILGGFTFVIGALIGTVFGINFDMLPENLAWMREARYRIMIFDSSKDVLTFFMLSLGFGIVHLITGYIIKMYMLIKDGEWVEAVCDHLPWVFLLLAPMPKFLVGLMPDIEPQLNIIFYGLLGLWAGIIIFFSERSTWNPVKRIGKGLFTLYGVSGVLGDVLSYSRLLALGLATGVIAGVMNTLAKMVKELPLVGIIGFIGVLLVGHLFNLFISGLSAFVHSIRLQFMEFFTKFYTGEGELLTAFTERRTYTLIKTAENKKKHMMSYSEGG